jgi:hypothetical protein
MRKQMAAMLAVASLLVSWLPAASSEVPQADAIFARAKNAWRARAEVPFVTYGLRERYEWRDRVHDNWWQVSYRSSDRALALQRVIVAQQEDARLRGVPITLNLRFHDNPARADSVDTNPDADAFPILDPQIEPNASFGMLAHEHRSALVGAPTPSPGPLPSATPASLPVPAATPDPGQTPLRELIRVEAVARDYRIELAGTERIRDVDTYHLTLTPLRDPHVYRLRDLWVDTQSYVTVQLALAGLFEGKPYDAARWIVTYVPIEGRYYVGQIKTDDQLRFGADRFVTGLQFDFVQYAFPQTIPSVLFDRFL